MTRCSNIIACGLAVLMSSPALADPPPASPTYLLTLPERRWAFAELLWQGRAPCKPELCEAGYHDGKLALSVMRGKDYLQAVAGVQGCQTVAYRVVRPDELSKLKADQRITFVRALAEGIAYTARVSCSYEIGKTVDTTPLSLLVTALQSLAN